MNENERLIQDGYLVEAVGYDRNKVIWEAVDDPFIEEETDHDEIGL